jgi:hypothetical protein
MELIEIIAIILVILLVISVNVGLIRAARGQTAFPEIELFRRVAPNARDPWKAENDNLMELSKLVSELRDQRAPSDQEKPNSNQDSPENI